MCADNTNSFSLINARQINCRRRDVSTRNVTHWRNVHISFLTEPNVSTLKNLRYSGTVYCDHNFKKVRSAIFVYNKCLNCTLIPHITNGDVVSVLLENQNVILVSVYCHNDPKVNDPGTAWPGMLEQAADYARQRNFKIIICADSNSWSRLWGSSYTNPRGEVVEEGIARHGLHVCNRGNDLTFASHVGESIIDITLTTDPSLISAWKVLSYEPSFSDHNIISFEINGLELSQPSLRRSVRNVNWKAVAIQLKMAMISPLPDSWSPSTLDDACDKLNESLQASLDAQAPRKPFKPKSSYWWNASCSEAKKVSMRKDRIARRRRTPANVKEARAAVRAYQKTIYEAKKLSWRNFISDVSSVHEMAKVNYVLKNVGKQRTELGLVQKADGTVSENKRESLETMMQVHFPGSRLLNEPVYERPEAEITHPPPNYSFITRSRWKAAVDAFSNNKAPGDDEIRAELLKSLDDDMIDYLLMLIRVSLALHYVPLSWRKVTVLFIPKDGKSDYSDPKAWRGISLLSVLMKQTERLLLWHIEESALLRHPTHSLQFGSTRGKSCDNALSFVTNYIEKGIHQNMYVLTVFMDIRGAFDNVRFDSIINAMRLRGVHEDIVAFYKHFLYNRTVSSHLGDATVEVCPRCGTPQGGVLSCRIGFCLVFDGFLNSTNNTRVTSVGFVDDGSLMIRGMDIKQLYKLMQKALDGATKWASENGLQFCPKKTVSVLFHRKQNPRSLPRLRLYGKDIPNVSEAKLLGVTFDSKLTWQSHINNKISACRGALARLRPAVGLCWGPEPQYMKWVYEACILPMLTYGCVVWGHAAQETSVINKLNKLQRMGLLSIAPVRPSTPTAALEIIYNIPPIHLGIMEKAQKTFLRLGDLQNENWTHSFYSRWRSKEYCERRRGHITNLRLSLPTITLDDDMTAIPNFDRRYSVTIAYDLPENTEDVGIFTDGSGIDGRIGSGSYFTIDGEGFHTISERLPSSATVYQAELRGIKMSCEYLIDNDFQGRTIAFHVDNMSSLQALRASFISSRIVFDTASVLNYLAKKNTVSLQWIKAHHISENNKIADDAAKAGCESETWSPDEFLESRTAMANHIRILRNETWTEKWQKSTEYRQSKMFLAGPDAKVWRTLKKLSKAKISNVIRFITGHTYLRRHNVVFKKKKVRLAADRDPDSECRLCREGPETPIHLLLECKALMWTRHTLFATGRLLAWQLDTPPPWSDELIAFINSPHIQALERRDEREEDDGGAD